MMEEKIKYIETLLERFFEGQTSNEEEQQLYLFFRQEEISSDLIQYKQVIKYFESELADELTCLERNEMISQNVVKARTETKYLPTGKKRWLVWSSVAASVLLILFSSIYFLTLRKPLDPYAGSYIIRNGVRITDLDLIRPELEAAIHKSLLLEQEADRLVERLSTIDDSREVQIMQQLQEHNQRILDNIQDENTRNEVEEILNPNI
jgi:hypothetical protein